jgi:hypothetical protein
MYKIFRSGGRLFVPVTTGQCVLALAFNYEPQLEGKLGNVLAPPRDNLSERIEEPYLMFKMEY